MIFGRSSAPWRKCAGSRVLGSPGQEFRELEAEGLRISGSLCFAKPKPWMDYIGWDSEVPAVL